MRNLLPALFCMYLLCFAALRQVSAQTNLYVSAGGNNTSNNCLTAGTPCATIAYALTQASPGNVIIATGNLTSEPIPLTITKSITLQGEQAGIKPVLTSTSPFSPVTRGTETQLNFATSTNHILIQDGVNNVTIEGFEFISGQANNSYTNALIIFENGTLGNDNIIIRRNIFNANGSTQRRFFLKDNTGGDLTNVKIFENRILGLNNFGVTSTSNGIAGIEIRKAGIGANEIRSNVVGTGDLTQNRVQKGISLSNVINFAVAENEFRNIVASPIEIVGTSSGGDVLFESNTFVNSNAGSFINETGLNSPIAAGINLYANAINSTSFIIRNNDFQGDNKMAIAIPAPYNNFTTNAIQITGNKFSNGNTTGNNSKSDLYIGNDTDVPTGMINTDGNWWGHSTTSAPNRILTSTSLNGSLTSDILGGTAGALARVTPVTWLNNGTDANVTAPGFISNKEVTFDGSPSTLQSAFNAIPEGWIFFVPANNYTSGPYLIDKASFAIRASPSSVFFGGLTIDNNRTLTLRESFGIIDDGISAQDLLLTNGGKIRLGPYDLYIMGQADVAGDGNSYVITDGLGRLVQTGIGISGSKTGDILFPVGPDNTSYTPVLINNNAGSSNDFLVNVQKGIVNSGNNGELVTENAVNLTWDVSVANALGTPNVTLTLQWNAGDPVSTPSQPNDEQPGFDREVSYMAHYTGGKWVNLEMPPGTPAQAGSIAESWKKTASGITSFSPFAIGSPGAALPVRLVDFKAQLHNHDVILSWITASETDNDYFAVERSKDGSIFSEIGKISGNGTIDVTSSYEFTDKFATEAGQGVLYYRLKQVDTDGKFSYSKIQDVVFHSSTLRLFPNPADQVVNIALPGKGQVQVISSQGQTVMQTEFDSVTQLNVSSLPKGMYIFKISNERDILLRKVNIF